MLVLFKILLTIALGSLADRRAGGDRLKWEIVSAHAYVPLLIIPYTYWLAGSWPVAVCAGLAWAMWRWPAWGFSTVPFTWLKWTGATPDSSAAWCHPNDWCKAIVRHMYVAPMMLLASRLVPHHTNFLWALLASVGVGVFVVAAEVIAEVNYDWAYVKNPPYDWNPMAERTRGAFWGLMLCMAVL